MSATTTPGRYRIWASPTDKLIGRLVAAQGTRLVGKVIHHLLCLRGTDVSPKASLGPGLHFKHGGIGVVIHARTRVGSRVTIYQGVTIGRADIWREDLAFAGVEIGDDVILGAGCAVLATGTEPLRIGAGTIVGANAVLTSSTGPDEVWAGSPARPIRKAEKE